MKKINKRSRPKKNFRSIKNDYGETVWSGFITDQAWNKLNQNEEWLKKIKEFTPESIRKFIRDLEESKK